MGAGSVNKKEKERKKKEEISPPVAGCKGGKKGVRSLNPRIGEGKERKRGAGGIEFSEQKENGGRRRISTTHKRRGKRGENVSILYSIGGSGVEFGSKQKKKNKRDKGEREIRC